MFSNKNTILAVVLSIMVVVGWQYFIGYPQMERQRQEAQLKEQEQAQVQPGAAQPSTAQSSATPGAPGALGAPTVPGTPSVAATPQAQAQSREAVIGSTPRIAIDTPRLGGSIDLKGGRIDDLTLQQYRETIDPNSPPIVLFSPSGAPEAYYA